jgi:PGAP1-like protein
MERRNFIVNYGILNNVGAVQADVVAHSMGGDIARTMAGLSAFTSQNNYGLGSVHKQITIGTPHTGTQLAFDLLPGPAGDPNACVRNAWNRFGGDVSSMTATVNGSTVDGAVGDLQATSLPKGPFSITYIAGSTTPANLSNLDATIFSGFGFIYNYCGKLWGIRSPCF